MDKVSTFQRSQAIDVIELYCNHFPTCTPRLKKINIVLQTLNVSPLVQKMEDIYGPDTRAYNIGTYIA